MAVAKNLNVSFTVVTTADVCGTHRTVMCSCGQSVSGKRQIVDEAHRQHLLHHTPRPVMTNAIAGPATATPRGVR